MPLANLCNRLVVMGTRSILELPSQVLAPLARHLPSWAEYSHACASLPPRTVGDDAGIPRGHFRPQVTTRLACAASSHRQELSPLRDRERHARGDPLIALSAMNKPSPPACNAPCRHGWPRVPAARTLTATKDLVNDAGANPCHPGEPRAPSADSSRSPEQAVFTASPARSPSSRRGPAAIASRRWCPDLAAVDPASAMRSRAAGAR
jgi:hypothetical protein